MGYDLTAYHAKYFAHDLTRRAANGMDRLSMSLFDASVDLNPHQIEAALFALESPLSKGVILADEVGLGKTIEAGIVLCQFWSEHKRRLLVLCPASLRKQWALELQEKFNLPVLVLDAKANREARRNGRAQLAEKAIVVMSHNYANSVREELKAIAWDLVVIDEAHKLRNAYRPSNKVGQGIRWATEDCRKLLLTATPLQNSLLELYGLSTLIDEHIFGDLESFRSQYTGAGSSIADLRQRISNFCKRTLRNQVTEYIRYTERRPITRPFKPSDSEYELYEAISGFLQRSDSYALPQRQRHLTALILRKLLASSSRAVAGTLDKLRTRLETLRDEKVQNDPEFAEELIATEDIEDDLLDEILDEPSGAEIEDAPRSVDRQKLGEEIALLRRLAAWAREIGIDTKTHALLQALTIGFEQMATTGAARKALIFTESRRTQDYLKGFLESSGHRGQVVVFNGSNNGAEATAIYESWAERHRDTGRSSRSRAVDVRTALIEHFRDNASVLLATEAAAEGINLQFCSLVINYDLPWNPQRIEQRIGRCHRYGQKHDVAVINFLNERNQADRRVLELLGEKFNLFNGVFGASDDVLGTIESGVDFEKRILSIYQECSTSEEIDAAFHKLQEEMDESIRARMNDTRQKLFDHFDEDVHQRLRMFYPISARAENGTVRLPCLEWDAASQSWRLLEKPLEGESAIWPVNDSDEQLRWKWGVDSFAAYPRDFIARPDQSGKTGVYMKSRMNEDGMLPVTWWDDKEYSATEYGTNLLTDVFGKISDFSFPKALKLVVDCLRSANVENDSLGLTSVSRDQNWTGWCRFFLEGVRIQAEDNLAKTRGILDLYDNMKLRVAEMTKSAYAIHALDWIFERPVFKTADFIASAGIPAPTARRFLRVLQTQGVVKVVAEGSGRRSAILAFADLLNIAEGRDVF